jgi:hypothetical protein
VDPDGVGECLERLKGWSIEAWVIGKIGVGEERVVIR